MTIELYNKILFEIRHIIKDTEWESHIFAVGGCVRDEILKNNINDIDICVDICNGGINFAKWLENNGYTCGSIVIYENFGTAMFHLKAYPEIEIEVVHTRKEIYRDDKSRNPETSFGTIEEDWLRRDFTINAIYENISTMEFIDFNNRGRNDIKNKIISTCDKPDITFQDDPLRILRCVRFSSRYGYTIDKSVIDSAKKNIDRLEIISKERITDEITKMFTYSKESLIQSLFLLHYIGGFKFIIPEYQKLDTYVIHKIANDIDKTLDDVPSIETVLAKLLSNVELLVDTKFKTKSEYITYILQTVLKFSNAVTKNVIFLIEMNDKLYKYCTDISISIYEHAYHIREIMNLCGNSKLFYDVTVCGSLRVFSEFHGKFSGCEHEQTMFEEFDENYKKYYTYKLPVNGEDVMEIFNIKPSSKVKNILNNVFLFTMLNTEETSREHCINYLKYLKKCEDENWLA